LIAGMVSSGIVDLFEIVDVDHQAAQFRLRVGS
jgi:hypothetical protein